jgi:hypothetical protein
METEFTLRKTMDNYNFYSIPREIGKLDSTAFNTPEGTILEARECCGLFHVSDSGGGIANATTHIRNANANSHAQDFALRACEFNIPFICIKFRGKKCWAACCDIGAAIMRKYINVIANKIKELKDLTTAPRLPEKDPAIEAILGILTSEQLETLLENDAFRKTSFGSKICKCCGKFTTEEMKKCLHYDCTGCCASCAKTPLLIPESELPGYGDDGGNANDVSLMVNVCRACKREQKTECPICQEDKYVKELCVLGCRHVFCWKCYGMGVFGGHQITKCPQCREIITSISTLE